MQLYEIWNSRFDVEPALYASFLAKDDEAALDKFEEYKNRDSLSWDNLHLVRVDQVRKETTIERSNAKDRYREGIIK